MIHYDETEKNVDQFNTMDDYYKGLKHEVDHMMEKIFGDDLAYN